MWSLHYLTTATKNIFIPGNFMCHVSGVHSDQNIGFGCETDTVKHGWMDG